MTKAKKIEHKGRIIRAEIRTSATAAQAWDAWADPEKIAAWFVDRASGEAKPGSIMTWYFDDFGFAQPLKVVEAILGERFVLRWEPPEGDPGILEVGIAREGGTTILRLVNSGFREGAQWDDEYQGTVSGWQLSLSILKHYLENFPGRRKSSLLLFRPAAYQYAELLHYFQDESKLAQWLTKSGSVGKLGDSVHLNLRDAEPLEGKVLAVTDREIAVSWDEIGGTLEFKAFPMGPQRVAGLRVVSWRLGAPATAELKTKLQASVDRLAQIFPAPVKAQSSPQ
jgi:uncharacterized protein YndB with AHSA1/START domain